jgi:hypothetical protein
MLVLAGCAPGVHSTVARTTDGDCGFRSATSCWTLGPRYPERRTQQADSAAPLLQPPPPALATAADTR